MPAQGRVLRCFVLSLMTQLPISRNSLKHVYTQASASGHLPTEVPTPPPSGIRTITQWEPCSIYNGPGPRDHGIHTKRVRASNRERERERESKNTVPVNYMHLIMCMGLTNTNGQKLWYFKCNIQAPLIKGTPN